MHRIYHTQKETFVKFHYLLFHCFSFCLLILEIQTIQLLLCVCFVSFTPCHISMDLFLILGVWVKYPEYLLLSLRSTLPTFIHFTYVRNIEFSSSGFSFQPVIDFSLIVPRVFFFHWLVGSYFCLSYFFFWFLVIVATCLFVNFYK